MVKAMKDKDTDGVAASALEGKGEVEEVEPETPLVVFVNSRSGGRHGAELKINVKKGLEVFDGEKLYLDLILRLGIALEIQEFPGETCSHSLRPPPDQSGYPPLPFIDWG
ncbi:hypothetical protein J5N97_009891 [Dioscorea zingiberensis]|uniref:DAGKc domain-containing protein n=1 Tax=Dioscorea zingiberensis TaxID=325984 RepID=A0A9D5CXQ4_9LILI|nr:hypothetical protein J5N97_009891 [Dioscorea zingiberensis]